MANCPAARAGRSDAPVRFGPARRPDLARSCTGRRKAERRGDRARLPGNTVSGRYTNGGFFTEYHDPDGQALGHNGWQSNTDACWITKPDRICYYYGPPTDRTVHCFSVEMSGDLYVLRNSGNGMVNALAKVEPSAIPAITPITARPGIATGLSRGRPVPR
jgi:hypothetical protein